MRLPALLCCVLLVACSSSGALLVEDSGLSGGSGDDGAEGSGGDEGGEEGGDDGGSSGDDGDDGWTGVEADASELPEGMPRVSIEIDPEAMARLDADPYESDDERGVFVDGEGARYEVDLSYRGAYALRSVMAYYDLRNWKVKLDDEERHLGRREWNFNYEPHFRQKLAYDLFRFAGVAVPQAQHVLLEVNGELAGMYLQYEDPDNKDWLWDHFGHDDGDLYKAAYDIPEQPQCFADLTVLGPDDSDYACHYSKKTNHKVAPGDFSVLMGFIEGLDALEGASDEAVDTWFADHVDVEGLRSYLVVSNFIANWDSYPQRPKNYWVYEDLRAERMVYVPWDLDGTFNAYTDGTYNQMGTTASVWFNLRESQYDPPHADEGRERPLVRRFLQSESQQQAYLDRYEELVGSLLNEAYLTDRLEALDDIVRPELGSADRGRLDSANAGVLDFIERRSRHVAEELESL